MPSLSLREILRKTKQIWSSPDSTLNEVDSMDVQESRAGFPKEKYIAAIQKYIRMIERDKITFLVASPKNEYTPLRYTLADFADNVLDVLKSDSSSLKESLEFLELFSSISNLYSELATKIDGLSDKSSVDQGLVSSLLRKTKNLLRDLRKLKEIIATLPNT